MFRRPSGWSAKGILALGLLALAIVGACEATDDPALTPVGGTAPGASDPQISAVGPGLTVREALDSTLDQPLLVNGFIVDRESVTRLCAELLESYPSQCGGESLVVEGLDLDSFSELEIAQGVTWSSSPTQVLGRVSNGVLTVSPRQSG